MSRRGRESAAFSLFAFQDIITSVTGIMILVTLILALELILRIETSPERKSQQIVAELQTTAAQVEQLEARVTELTDSLSQGAARIGEVAGLNADRMRANVAEVAEFNEQVTSDLARLAKEQQDALQRRDEAHKAQQRRASDPQRIKELQDRVKQKLKTLEKLRQSNRVIFNPTQGETRTPWLVEITSQTFTVAQVGISARPESFANLGGFQAWAKARDPRGEYMVLLVKPDGIENYRQARELLQRMRFEIGYDLLTEEQMAIDAQTGAMPQ